MFLKYLAPSHVCAMCTETVKYISVNGNTWAPFLSQRSKIREPELGLRTVQASPQQQLGSCLNVMLLGMKTKQKCYCGRAEIGYPLNKAAE